MTDKQHDNRLSLVVTYLMKGIIYREDKPEIWEALSDLEGTVRDYLSVMGLDVQIFDVDGFAYLENRTPEETEKLPRLISRRQLSYPVSLLLALLRRKLTEHDTYSSESRLILEKSEIQDMVSAFFPAGNNEVRFLKRLDVYIKRIHELGFIRYPGNNRDKIEVLRILKAFVDAQWLSDFDQKLNEYASYAEVKG